MWMIIINIIFDINLYGIIERKEKAENEYEFNSIRKCASQEPSANRIPKSIDWQPNELSTPKLTRLHIQSN